MGQWEQENSYLIEKMKIFEKIAVNTETQYRFIHKREMRGLGRVLEERGMLLEALAILNKELARDQTWKKVSVLALMNQEIMDKGQAILERSRQVLQEAMAERNSIAIELKNNKVHRQVKNRYVNPWAIVASGNRFNAKG